MAYRLRAQDVNHLVRDLGSPGTGSDGAAAFRCSCIETFRPGRAPQTRRRSHRPRFSHDTEMTAYFRPGQPFAGAARGKPISAPNRRASSHRAPCPPGWMWRSAGSRQPATWTLLKILRQIREVLGLGIDESEDAEIPGDLAMFSQNLSEIRGGWLTMDPQSDQIYWVELDPLQGRLTLPVRRCLAV